MRGSALIRRRWMPRLQILGRGVTCALLLITCARCNTEEPLYIGRRLSNLPPECQVLPTTPPAALSLDAFYGKYVDARGIAIVSSAAVDDRALAQACGIIVHALPTRADIVSAMVERHLHIAVLGRSEVTTVIPEYRDLYEVWPDSDWDSFRGVGATLVRPVASVGEENLLCDATDPYPGEAILFGTYSHGLRMLGIEPVDETFATRLEETFTQATAAGLWSNTAAGSASKHYFAEGLQDWFDANSESSSPDGLHNSVNTRDELAAYDPELTALLGDYLSAERWTPGCP